MRKGPWCILEPSPSLGVDSAHLIEAIAEMPILDIVEILDKVEAQYAKEEKVRFIWLGKKDKMPQNSRRHFQTNPDGTFAYPVPDRKKGHRNHGK